MEKDQVQPIEVIVMSFGFKGGTIPLANLIFDVRFLKNPYWDEQLRGLTGEDSRIKEYVYQQELTADFLTSLLPFLESFINLQVKQNESPITIAFGCTGGQHRSVAIVELVVNKLKQVFPHFKISKQHRELSSAAVLNSVPLDKLSLEG
jgi:UPF0042 nucleotide-binding protein